MIPIQINLDAAFENCDVPEAEAISLVANYLNKIIEIGKVSSKDFQCEKIIEGFGESKDIDDIQDRVMMEQCVLETVLSICKSMRVKAVARIDHLQKVYDATKLIENEMDS